ncbi:DUF2793 domain-containing protein [Devosia equisanguinis]|nr:DUF2793 domain-containing protein [Devosia equisanguinis]
MMQTDRLNMPFIAAGQALKHITHNEALQMLDVLVQPVVEAANVATPPATPDAGSAWIVPIGATGAWAGEENTIAVWQAGTWCFLMPEAGWQVFDRQAGSLKLYSGSAWIAVAAIGAGLPQLGVNTSADSVNRLAVAAEAVLLTHDGAGHQLKINKATSGDTASLLFQSNWTGQAEMGLMGDNDWRIKVSADGVSWVNAVAVNATTGAVTLASGLRPSSDNSASLGASGARWSAIWSATGTIETSDLRLKTDIVPSTLGLDFVQKLNPVSYRWREGSLENGEAQPGRRTHYGFIAQDVAETISALDIGDFAGHVLADPDDPLSSQALRYTQFIAPLVKAVQELAARIEHLERAGD